MTRRQLPSGLLWLVMVLVEIAGPKCSAAEPTLAVLEKPPPAELDSSIRAMLQPRAVQIQEDGQPMFEYWLAKEVALAAAPAAQAKALDAVKTAALLGAMSVTKPRRDYRDDDLPVGVYTLRFALQPQDGNHLGTAEFTYFAVAVAAKNDPNPGAITGYKPLVKASAKNTAAEHPMIISLRPASAGGHGAPKLNEPLPDHRSVRVEISGRIPGQDAPVPVPFEIVFQGMGKK